MSLSITIPDEIVETVKGPRNQVKQVLCWKMAFALYAQGIASLGAARRLAKLDKWQFLDGPAERRIDRHYFDTELEEDNEYAVVFNKQAAMSVTKDNPGVKKDTTGLCGAWQGDLLLPKRCQ